MRTVSRISSVSEFRSFVTSLHKMALQGLLSHFTGNEEVKNVDRVFPGFNPFGHQQRYQTYGHPYQFPHGAPHEHVFPDETHDFSLKFGQGDGGGGGTQYGPPPEMKKGKGKGAALSALTLLAFLFFLNLLQSCLKDHMDAMNPTVNIIQHLMFSNLIQFSFR